MKLKREYIFPISIVLSLMILMVIGIFYNMYTRRHITTGAWTEGLFNPSTQTLHPEKLIAFEKLIGKKVSIAHYYRGWEALSDPNLITQFDALRDNEWTPMLNVNPYYFAQCPVTDKPLYKAIAEGKCDTFLHAAGRNLSRIKKPFYLLFAWEMNNKQLEWSVEYSGSSSEDFVAAWRRVHTIFKQEKATNIIWVFCPNTEDSTSISYDRIYPGTDYVDWIGLDGYNWGTTQSWSQWKSFSEVFTASYNHLTSIAPDKPMMIAEVNTTDQGGNKSQWYTDMFARQIPHSFPKIDAVIIYNENRSTQEQVNWKIDITPETLQAFIKGIHLRFYK